MRIGVGLPSIIPGTSGRQVIEWAREAERLGFARLATIGRIAFPALDELVALAAAAAVTTRIELLTNVLIGPAREPVELAKQAASLDVLSDGRFVLGLGVGSREDDFTTVDRPFHTRGRRFDTDLEVMARVWAGELVRGAQHGVSPKPTNGVGVPMLFGGGAEASFERMVRLGIGWTAGGGPVERAAGGFERARAAWKRAGRDGEPKLFALVYYGIGEASREQATRYLGDYYGEWGLGMVGRMPVEPADLKSTVRAFEGIGTDELIFVPTGAGIEQLTGLADAVLGLRVG